MYLKKLWQWACTGPWIEREDTEYKYTIEGDTLKITFMGSSNFTTKGKKRIAIDWKHNFSFFIKPYRKMKPLWFAHKGFTIKWKIVEDEILQLVKDNPDIQSILITGFSQGAAIATLAHESIWFHYPQYRDTLKSIVFGSPRVIWFWNRWKIRDRWESLTRIKNGWDIVTDVPPIWFGYGHVGSQKRIGRKWWQISFRFKHNHLHYGEHL